MNPQQVEEEQQGDRESTSDSNANCSRDAHTMEEGTDDKTSDIDDMNDDHENEDGSEDGPEDYSEALTNDGKLLFLLRRSRFVFEQKLLLEELEIKECNLDKRSFQNVLQTIRDSKVLKKFTVDACSFDKSESMELAAALSVNKSLDTVYIRGDFSTYPPVASLCALLESSVVGGPKSLNYCVHASSSDLAAIFEALGKNKSLTQFWLEIDRSQRFRLEDLDTMVKNLKKNTVLAAFILECKPFVGCSTDAVKKLLQELDSCSSLRCFHLGGNISNFIENEELTNFIHYNRHVSKLNLWTFQSESEGLERYIQAISECNVNRELVLSANFNPINSNELSCLFREIPKMKTLTGLHLSVKNDVWKDTTYAKDFLQAVDRSNIESISFLQPYRFAWERKCCWVSPHSKARFLAARNRFRKLLDGSRTTIARVGDPPPQQQQQPALNLWPRILYVLDHQVYDGKSIMFWALRSYGCQAGIALQSNTVRKRQRFDDLPPNDNEC